MQPDDIKAQAQARFGHHADAYVTSATHASGHDLDLMLELAAPKPDALMLDIATGGGHTALRFAPQVRRVRATDFTAPMLDKARAFITAQGAANVDFLPADAENLPFLTNTFDLVTCRIAPHHFPDVYRFVCEAARVLRPGGLLVIQDHLLPDDARAANYITAIERLRDPSHVRGFNDAEWRGLMLDAGLAITFAHKLTRPGKLVEWAVRQGCSPDVIERLQILMVQAPSAVHEWMNIRCAGTADAGFDHTYLLIGGRKP
jgi:SAM-dependent methyltransferase